MRNFMQFVIPLIVIVGIGFLFMWSSTEKSSESSLYVSCNDTGRQKFKVISAMDVEYRKGPEECHINIRIIDVGDGFVKIGTPSLWRTDTVGEIDDAGTMNSHSVDSGRAYIAYSVDKKTKFRFEFK